ncbi:MAG: aldehyde dehydrogenase family protein, partial [Patescibacteria group bacterium]|nr:aldehyde dehydrogenase family protein [Patescibacteria group bacterium]
MKNKLISTNPAKNYEVIGSVDISSSSEIKQKVDEAQKAKTLWKELGIKKRLEYVGQIYERLTERKSDLISIIIKETGKSLKDAQ